MGHTGTQKLASKKTVGHSGTQKNKPRDTKGNKKLGIGNLTRNLGLFFSSIFVQYLT